ncbi:EamA family transporter RarD [Robertmurraya sp. DFI.2.37]|jgi:chloramphenicol-sensitive protein RarD|uniref:EamA family transporter RarD n=1 Tax=Robertmurraya sp. DFI.2.37 TaxID=3031819 RepID=UPI001248FEED|nr:EamA family transporter RarD [Robertmurraya sp. DFI.2.37]MDF1508726.1 EamA family transporter RarD [Robertmurraya sp. DFI.2.37]
MKENEVKVGVLQAAFSYLIWGLLPIYWKLLEHVNADEILANRVIWSFVLMVLLLLLTRKWPLFLETLKGLKQNQKRLWALITASLLVSGNWFVYIWAVNHDQMIQASLGYYINPLVSVLLGVIFLHEKLSPLQYISFTMATVGVLILSISYGQIPWIALALAFSFGLYGLAKKLIKVDSTIGLTLETMVVTPLALGYVIYLFVQEQNMFLAASFTTDLLLIGAGAATALPLLYFAKGAQKIPLSMLGFIQYIAPTLTLILGVFFYGEHFTKTHLLSFIFIWGALTIYSLSKTKILSRQLKWKKGSGLGV